LIALRTLTRNHVVSVFPPKLFWLSLVKRKRPLFRLSEWLPTRTARTRAACVSLSFFNDVKQREGFGNPSFRCLRRVSMPDPFWAVPAIPSQCISNSDEVPCAASAARPLSGCAYMRGSLRVSSTSLQKFCGCEKAAKTKAFGVPAGLWISSFEGPLQEFFCPSGRDSPTGFDVAGALPRAWSHG